MTDSGCRNCGGTGWTLHPSWSGKGDERYEPCECDRRTPPTPATDEREAVARALCIAGEEDDFNYKGYLELADAALSALAPIRAQEIAAAEARERERVVALCDAFDAAERERDALREALRPFAMVAEHDIDNSEHDNDLYVGNGGRYNRAPSLHVRHFRAALTANHSAPVVEE